MGMLFFRVPSAKSTRATYAARLNGACRELYDGDDLSTDVFAITYTDTAGVEWACPGNGDKALTRPVVDAIAAQFAATNMDIFYRERGRTDGLTRVESEESWHPPSQIHS